MNGRYGKHPECKKPFANVCSSNAAEGTEGKNAMRFNVHGRAHKGYQLPSIPSGNSQPVGLQRLVDGEEKNSAFRLPSVPSVERILAIEAEYEQPMVDVVRGFFADGEDLVTTAAILELRPTALRNWCRKQHVEFLNVRRRQMPRVQSDAKREKCRRMARRQHRCPMWQGRQVSCVELSQQCGISERTLRDRIARGLPVSLAIRIPPSRRNRWSHT